MIECTCKNAEFKEKVGDRKIVLFGASSAARNFLLEYDVEEKILFIVDNDKKKANTKFRLNTWEREFDITMPDVFFSADLKDFVIVITSTYYAEIISQLQEIDTLKDIECYTYLLFERESFRNIMHNLSYGKDGIGCCGCEACVQACPVSCISMKIDQEGFAYPVTDYDKCTRCGLCNNVCPIEKRAERSESIIPEFFCVFNNEESVMKNSSSGGIFSPLAEEIIHRGGVVYGAESSDGMTVWHSRAATLEDYKKFRKSKYLQSSIRSCYAEAKEDLEQGIPVLFSGTPCQIGGLYKYLQHSYDNLYTVDVICHGVPSKAVFDRYAEEIQQYIGEDIDCFNWRCKENGWDPKYFEIQFKSNKSLVELSKYNGFSRGFNSSLFLRPSCYNCSYNDIPRIADISLGDFWGYEGSMQDKNKNQGLSVMVISTSKGKELFHCIEKQVIWESVSLQYATDKNYHIAHPSTYHLKREAFFSDFKAGKPYTELAKKYLDMDIFEKLSI